LSLFVHIKQFQISSKIGVADSEELASSPLPCFKELTAYAKSREGGKRDEKSDREGRRDGEKETVRGFEKRTPDRETKTWADAGRYSARAQQEISSVQEERKEIEYSQPDLGS
jgi:hypothetical protein